MKFRNKNFPFTRSAVFSIGKFFSNNSEFDERAFHNSIQGLILDMESHISVKNNNKKK